MTSTCYGLVVIVVLNVGLAVVKSNSLTNDEKIVLLEQLLLREVKVKPIFFASLQTHPYRLQGENDVIKFNDVRVNREGGYDPSTGHFTAPQKGVYQFSCMILGQHRSTVSFQLNKNDKMYTYGYVDRGSGYDSQTLNAIMELQIGDRVYVKHRGTSLQQVHGNHHSTFSGHFLQE